MPAFLSHYILAKSVRDYIYNDKNIQSKIQNFEKKRGKNGTITDDDRVAFLWGSQGADILFLSPTLRKYGSKLHNAERERILSILRNIYDNNSCKLPILFYILGFITHFSFDNIAHPLINEFCEDIYHANDRCYSTRLIHAEIEYYFDTVLVYQKMGVLPSQIDTNRILPASSVISTTISYVYSRLLRKMFCEFGNTVANKMFFNKTCSIYKNAIKLSRDSTGQKKKSLVAIEDILKIKHYLSPYISNDFCCMPFDGVGHISEFFIDIFYKAKTESIGEINKFLR